jgi:hypothetical protein
MYNVIVKLLGETDIGKEVFILLSYSASLVWSLVLWIAECLSVPSIFYVLRRIK